MTKYCFNYDTGEYEYIDKNGYSTTKANTSIIGTTANISVKKRKKKEKPKRKKIAASVKMRNINRAPDTRLLH